MTNLEGKDFKTTILKNLKKKKKPKGRHGKWQTNDIITKQKY